MKNTFLYFFIFIISFGVSAQETMDSGFKMLETGDFAAAEVFFKQFLEGHPDNKTAKLCYGRAVGLNGEPLEANGMFKDLLEDYPGDLEIIMNYYESFLWARKFKEARPLYQELVKQYPDNFGALLGFANTLSNLKEYPLALQWIDKAIALQPENESAKVSKKFMKLGYANEYVTNQEYDMGEQLLKDVFVLFPEDKDALLNLANVYLITKETDTAIVTYKRFATTKKDSITALHGIALAHHIGEDDKIALAIAEQALDKAKRFDNYELLERSHDRYAQALIWNGKYVKAKNYIEDLKSKYPNENWVRATDATLGMYTGRFKMSIDNYNAILESDSTSFDGNLGKANAMFASDKIKQAYQAAYTTLKVFHNQKDASNFIEKLNTSYIPYIEDHAYYTFDNGNNVAFANQISTKIPLSIKVSTNFSYHYRATNNTLTENEASTNEFSAGLEYKMFPKVNWDASVGLNKSSFGNESYSQPVINVTLKLQPLPLQNLDLGYKREMQSFNADLIQQEIIMNHYGLNYNLGTNFNLGWYTQLIHTRQSDENLRNLLFTSLYYNFSKKPAFKMGVNFQYITFKDQVPTIYFSPEVYKAVEVFADLRGNFSEKFSYLANAATGLQFVEDDEQTNIFRAELGFKYKPSERFSAEIYGKYSNIASATAAGFEFTQLGLKVKWLFLKKPLFHKKIASYQNN